MLKRLEDLTQEDKIKYYNAVKRDYERRFGIPWKEVEKRLQKDIDDAFDDEAFAKMDPEFAIDAAYARRDFGKNKPDIVDYMLWAGKFVTHSEFIEIPD